MVPRSASRRTSAATNVLLMLPTEKSVSAVTGAALEMTPTPDWPVHVDPSGKAIAAWTPGSFASVRIESRASVRAASVVAPRWAIGAVVARSSRGIGTGTIVGVGTAVGVAVANSDAVGDAVGVGLGVTRPHAATSRPPASRPPASAASERNGRAWRRAAGIPASCTRGGPGAARIEGPDSRSRGRFGVGWYGDQRRRPPPKRLRRNRKIATNSMYRSRAPRTDAFSIEFVAI